MQKDSILKYKNYKTLMNVILVATLFLSIGYAQIIAPDLTVEGTATAYQQEGVYVSGVSYSSSNYADVDNSSTKQRVGSTISSKVVLEDNQSASITYQVNVTNRDTNPYIYIGPSVSDNFYSNNQIKYTITGINENDIINPEETKSFNLTYSYEDNVTPTSTELDAYINFGFRQIYPITYTRIDGTGYPEYVVKWKSTDNKQSNLSVDFGSNAPEEIIITGGETGTVYELGADYTYTNGVLSFPNVSEPLTIAAPVPNDPPVITNLQTEQQATVGSVKVAFAATDDNGLDHYEIETYHVVSGVETLISTDTVSETETEFTKTNLVEGDTYFFKVKVYDIYGLTAEQSSTANTYQWAYTATINITNGGPNGTTNISYGNEYSVRLTVNNGYYSINNMTVTMGGTRLTTSQYTFNQNNGDFSIPKITGNISITGTASQNFCLIEGTKVRLANNEEKNIEDIKYDDLLLVWSYEKGKVVEEYPLWIEKEKKTQQYTKITFSDQSTINIYYDHAFFSTDINKFVSVRDKNNFHIGTKVLKVTKENTLKEVSVEKIEPIQEEKMYYFVASTRYYNIISDDFITTDAYTDITNLYEFDKNATWKEKPSQELDYRYLEDVLPYYMYKGFRAGEVAILINSNKTTIPEFKNYIENIILDDTMMKEPIQKNNTRYWPVSTGNKWKKNKKLIKEGDYYQLPFTYKTKKWYSTSENKYYNPGDKVQVWTGMHFESIS